ncbi:ATP-binding protein [Pedobacter antarcticus]|uniref:GAF domain-containing sensor histidine kinase n=1 Tax=Pedobacter antarcticus TaxID=34086 RepID=UPI001C5789DC|nr:GAF domain-containing sensor histidine kinase [Pedobacter antarcticus]
MNKNLEEKLDSKQKDIDAINQIPVINQILEVICGTTGMGFAAIARVTPDSWTTCAVRDEVLFGLKPGDELQIETTICNEIQMSRLPVVINHVANDLRYADHHTPKMYGFQSYISIPIITKDGSFFGTLCSLDPEPAILDTPQIMGMFKLFADLIAFHLHAIQELTISETSLHEEQKTSELRDQFIAILGHDLRNPVGAIRNGAQLLLRSELKERDLKLVNLIKDSSYRITGLIENVLDFARGRLGDGITLAATRNEMLKEDLDEVIGELNMIWPGRKIETIYDLDHAVHCDGKRIAQLFSNLLGNALTYSAAESVVTVKAFSDTQKFHLEVINTGNQIPDSKLERLFEPFSRIETGKSKDGLGLGLYISKEIANAHGGQLLVDSNSEHTCFKLIIPSIPAD